SAAHHALPPRRSSDLFELLESLCDEGWIGVYGTATWDGYRVPPDAREHLSLRTLAALAREVGGESHRLRVVQAPYNVVMPEAARSEEHTSELQSRENI